MSELPIEETLEHLDSLLKANGGASEDQDESKDDDDDDDDEGFDAEYMKKHMKRFMQDNKDYMKKYMKDMDGMQKAFSDAIPDVEILESHDATLIDGTEFFKAFAQLGAGLLKSVTEIGKRLETLENSIVLSEQLTKASAAVVADIRRQQANLVTSPAGGPRFVAGTENSAQRATQLNSVRTILLQKATSGDAQASAILPRLEIANWNIERLTPAEQAFVASAVQAAAQ